MTSIRRISDRPKIVIIGAGFGGLAAARKLARQNLPITLIDRRSYHLFTPLLYQVATGSLNASEVAVPLRLLFHGAPHVTTLMVEVKCVDLDAAKVQLLDGTSVSYDYLVVATGAQSHYFGKESEWKDDICTLDDLSTAERLRDRFLSLCEQAERAEDEAQRKRLLTFAIIGAGPSGVELAGAISAIVRRTFPGAFRRISPRDVQVILFEAEERVLSQFDSKLSSAAAHQLTELGVDLRTNSRIEDVSAHSVTSNGSPIECGMICWGGGVRPADLTSHLGVATRKSGVPVTEFCTIPDHENVFAIGDMTHFETDHGLLPGVAPVALQQGRYVAKTIERDLKGLPRRKFSYREKGMMATIGPASAVVQSGPLRIAGLIAWIFWVVLHIWYLVGFRTRLLVLLEWAYIYCGSHDGNRLIRSENAKHIAPQSR